MTEEVNNTEADKPINPQHNFRHIRRIGREFSVQFLFQLDMADVDSVDGALGDFWEQVEESDFMPMNSSYSEARQYAERLITGILDRKDEIDSLIGDTAKKWDINRMAAVDRNIMRVAVFEMLEVEDVPPLVSINEAIEISKDFSDNKSAKFINGILDKVKKILGKD